MESEELKDYIAKVVKESQTLLIFEDCFSDVDRMFHFSLKELMHQF